MPKQQEPREGFVAVGRVLRPWGLRGDVKAESLTDFPERFQAGARLWVAGEVRTVEHSRTQKGDLYLKLSGIDDPDRAERLREQLIEVSESELTELPQGDYYHYQLEGLTVRTLAGEVIGTVAEVLSPGGNAVLVVRGDRGEVLVPFIDDVIRNVDLDGRAVEIDPMEGMLPELPAATRPSRPRRQLQRHRTSSPRAGSSPNRPRPPSR